MDDRIASAATNLAATSAVSFSEAYATLEGAVLTGLDEWLTQQIEGIQRSSMNEASRGALNAFVRVQEKLADRPMAVMAETQTAEKPVRRRPLRRITKGMRTKLDLTEQERRVVVVALSHMLDDEDQDPKLLAAANRVIGKLRRHGRKDESVD